MRYRSVAATLLFIVLAPACANEPTAPLPGAIAVTVQTSGGEPDDDRMTVVVASAVRGITVHSPITIPSLNPGTYTVALTGVAGNCTVTGPNPVSVTVPSGKTAEVSVALVCATTGFQITTRTTGYANPFSYPVLVNDSPIEPIDPNGSLLDSRAPPGTYKVALTMPGDHCKVTGGQPVMVDVSNRAVTPVHFEIACVPPLRPEKIVYVAGQASSPQIWIALVNPDGSGAVNLELGHSPAWSPDGTRLVFSTTQCDYYYACYGTLVVLDPEVRRSVALYGAANGSSPAWAPSGDVIAFIDGQFRLMMVRLDGSPAVWVPVASAFVNKPAWSPDGRRIACVCTNSARLSTVCVVNRDGSGFERLTTDDITPDKPAWSPDGRRIAFTIWTGSSHQIAVMAADGSGLARLTNGFDVAWSRDGAKLIFARDDGLFTVDVDGSNVKRLTTGPVYEPAWRP